MSSQHQLVAPQELSASYGRRVFPGDLITLPLGGQQLAPYVHNDLQRAVLALPGQDVTVVLGSRKKDDQGRTIPGPYTAGVTPEQCVTHRPSYVNGFLIQSRGNSDEGRCTACARTKPGLSPFVSCTRLPGHFGGACANCKWRDHTVRCSHYDGPLPRTRRQRTEIEEEDEGDDQGELAPDGDAAAGGDTESPYEEGEAPGERPQGILGRLVGFLSGR